MADFDVPRLVLPGPETSGPDWRTLGQRLASRRAELGWESPEELSKATRATTRRIPTARIVSIEQGRTYPSRSEITALAHEKALNCSAIYLTHGIAADGLTAVEMSLKEAVNARVGGETDRACRAYELMLTSGSLIQYVPELYQDAVSGYAEALAQFGDHRTVEGLGALASRTAVGERSWGTVQAQLVAHHRRTGDLTAAIETGRAGLFAQTDRRARWGTAGITIAVELLPAYVQAGQYASADQLIDNLIERVGTGREPGLQFMTHVAIARAAAQMDRAAPAMHQAAASDNERLMFHANQAYEIAMAFGEGQYHPAQLCRMASGHAQLLLTNDRAGPARMALHVLSPDRLPWNSQQPATIAYRELYTAKALRVLGHPELATARLTAHVLSQESSWGPDLSGRALYERGRAYTALGRAEDGAQDLYNAVEYLTKANLHDEAVEASNAWHELTTSPPSGDSAQVRPALPARSADVVQRMTAAASDHTEISTGAGTTGHGRLAGPHRLPPANASPPPGRDARG